MHSLVAMIITAATIATGYGDTNVAIRPNSIPNSPPPLALTSASPRPAAIVAAAMIITAASIATGYGDANVSTGGGGLFGTVMGLIANTTKSVTSQQGLPFMFDAVWHVLLHSLSY